MCKFARGEFQWDLRDDPKPGKPVGTRFRVYFSGGVWFRRCEDTGARGIALLWLCPFLLCWGGNLDVFFPTPSGFFTRLWRTKFFAQRQQLPWPAPATALVACILFPCTVALRALQVGKQNHMDCRLKNERSKDVRVNPTNFMTYYKIPIQMIQSTASSLPNSILNSRSPMTHPSPAIRIHHRSISRLASLRALSQLCRRPCRRWPSRGSRGPFWWWEPCGLDTWRVFLGEIRKIWVRDRAKGCYRILFGDSMELEFRAIQIYSSYPPFGDTPSYCW